MTLRRRDGARLAAVLVVAGLLFTGCVPHPGDDRGPNAEATLYSGAIPAPAAMPESPHLPPYPRPPADRSDQAAFDAVQAEISAYAAAFQAAQAKVTAQTAAVKKLAAQTQKGDAASVAAWESLLVTAGIAVQGADGKPVALHGDTGSGWPMADAELRLHTLLAASPGGMRLTDLAETLGPTFKVPAAQLAQELYTDLSSIPDHDFAVVYNTIGPGLFQKGKPVALADVDLNWAQVELILRRMATELVIADARSSGAATSGYRTDAGPAIAPASYRAPDSVQGSRRPCQNSGGPWSEAIADQSSKTYATFVFDKMIEEAAEEGSKGAKAAGRYLPWARILLSAASLFAKATALEASFSLSSSPLVRTKDTRPGEVRDLEVTYTFNPGKWQTVRECLNVFLAPFGIEIPGTSPEPPSDMDVQLSSEDPSILRVGDGTGRSTKVDSDQTDSEGKASFKVSGAPQADRIPDQAKPDDKTVTVRAANDLKSANFYKDVLSAGWDANDAVGSAGLSLVPDLIARSKFITFRYPVPVRDWKLDADFQVTAVGEATERIAYNEVLTGCGSDDLIDDSVKGTATFASDTVDVSAKLLSNAEGNVGDQAVVFGPRGEDFQLRDAGRDNGVLMFTLPVTYKTERIAPSPGEQPERHTEQAGGCVGGGGFSSPPKQADDCGVRSYDSTLDATIPKPRHLYVADEVPGILGLWKNCGTSALYPEDPPVAPSMNGCESPKVTGGRMPSTADIFDASKKRLDVSGTLSCRSEAPGRLWTLEYNWSLQFCRVENGKPDC
jgi:hypothetical protein